MSRPALLTIAFLLALRLQASAHPWAVSLAEVEFNPKEKAFEIALRVHPDSFDRALSLHQKKAVQTPGSREKLLLSYLEQEFRITLLASVATNSKTPPIVNYRWVGEKEERGFLWLFFEIPWTEPTNHLVVRSTILFAVYPEQVNTVIIEQAGRSATCTLNRKLPEAAPQWQPKDSNRKNARPGLGF